METIALCPGVTLRCCRDKKFTQGCLSFQLVRRLEKTEAAYNALFPAVLLRGTNMHPDLRSITEHLDTLYGASVSPLVRRVGDYQTAGLYCSFIDERFTMGDPILSPMVDFLEELLLDASVENGGFQTEFVDSEKRNLVAAIQAEGNDKRIYAMNQLFRTMCREDSFGLPRTGEPEDVQAVGAADLYRHYRRILQTSQIELFYVGSADADTLCRALEPLAGRLQALGREPESLPAQTAFHPCPVGDVTEVMDVTQGKLCLGFTTPITFRHPGFAAMQVLNTLYGAGMTSKLFMNLREKMSLCYSIGSSYYGSKGIMVVSAGIDCDKEALTRQEALRQLDDCRAGDIAQEELLSAKEAIVSSLRATHDAPGAIESYYTSCLLGGLDWEPETYQAAVERVTREDVVAAASTLELHTTYFLKGDRQ